MKKTSLSIIICALILIPFFGINVSQAQAAENTFAKNLSGRFLLDVENDGSIWYVDTVEFEKHSVTWDNALELFENLSLGITNEDLLKIPSSRDGIISTLDSDKDGYPDILELENNYSPYNSNPVKFATESSISNRLKGKLLLQVEQGGRIWYVDLEGIRHHVTFENLLPLFESLSLGISQVDLNRFDDDEEHDPYDLSSCEGFKKEWEDIFDQYGDVLYKTELTESEKLSTEEFSNATRVMLNYAECYSDKAIEKNDVSICEEMLTSVDIDYCKMNYGAKKEDASICDTLNDATLSADCHKVSLWVKKGRDARRLSEVKRIITAIELTHIEGKQILNDYVDNGANDVINVNDCNFEGLGELDNLEDPIEPNNLCTIDSKEPCQYSIYIPDANNYKIYFYIESSVSTLQESGLYYADGTDGFVKVSN